MTGPAREWVTIPVPGKERRRWQIDVTFLTSRWQCIFGHGCQGVYTEPTPDLQEGCCSYGAHADSKKDKRRVERAAEQLTADEWQLIDVGRRKGVWASVGKDGARTRLVDDACIFLNRPDFARGAGCALHLLAERLGVHVAETKPIVCWQLPLRAIEREEDDGSTTTVLTEFARDGWGEGGDEFAWWCTEAPEAFGGAEPVYRSLEPELRRMVGDEVFDELAKYLDERIAAAPPVRHPAEVPVSIRRTRQHPHLHG